MDINREKYKKVCKEISTKDIKINKSIDKQKNKYDNSWWKNDYILEKYCKKNININSLSWWEKKYVIENHNVKKPKAKQD